MPQDTDCIFCKIVRGEIPSTKVYEDEGHITFEDISPKAPVHYLVVPKEHSPRLDAMAPGPVGSLLEAAVQAAQVLGLDDYRLVVNVGAGAGQEVFHTHVHILSGWQGAPGPLA
ncbi:MAG TPA: histidine triad nucleotide-binding protein [Trueperaceae bacterium]